MQEWLDNNENKSVTTRTFIKPLKAKMQKQK